MYSWMSSGFGGSNGGGGRWEAGELQIVVRDFEYFTRGCLVRRAFGLSLDPALYPLGCCLIGSSNYRCHDDCKVLAMVMGETRVDWQRVRKESGLRESEETRESEESRGSEERKYGEGLTSAGYRNGQGKRRSRSIWSIGTCRVAGQVNRALVISFTFSENFFANRKRFCYAGYAQVIEKTYFIFIYVQGESKSISKRLRMSRVSRSHTNQEQASRFYSIFVYRTQRSKYIKTFFKL